ncbi:L,D-transpeptidase [Mycolicibacterium litorale]|uniref:Transpeptidase n=1 Tax=Mycolicibacterium litorale TaxID=758802 RepID=A0AAD1MUQ5_9MYCO|nr:Ig-like domain-containing protein [Mycolicibacterium litorale]MCV7416698.1 L,D-transpeptidase family protein [Mycolicibacterium litorale]TDY09950.1 lipoprotein-anchoring transpeptidase ErfK/SrfK [Mycolicibacterium litorale]BBY17910.1 transpeptidase [Mycolicibacterium litorale]
MSAADKLPPINRRRALTALAVGLVAPGALAACSRSASNTPEPAEAPASASLSFTPATSATDVAPTEPVRVEVTGGWFQRVALTNSEGKAVAGALNQDRNVFTVSEPLGYGVTYSWSGSAVGEDGKAVPVKGEFTTLDPSTQVSGQFQLSDGQTVGVAAPIILQFDASIDDADRATVEKSLSVTTNPPTEGSWAWLPDEAAGSRVHWRSKEYFAPGTTVRVDAKLYGVKFGEDAYGAADASLDFSIGRRQVVKAEASSHRIQVIDQGGAVIMDFPCSYGEGDLDRNVTRSGIHVVTEKYEDFYMTNPAAGYANVRERFAVRISNNGEFIHANPASSGAQGNSNVTNGCINLSITDAEQYFRTAVYGDPVEVTGTRIQLSYADGDIWDWAVSWDEWKSMSALSDENAPTGIPSTAPVTPTGAPQPVNGRPGG